MAEDWAYVAEGYEEEDEILIGKMDCTKEANSALCQELGVTSYPTLLYGDVTDLKNYKGQRGFRELREVVEDFLEEPLCGTSHPHLCTQERQQQIEGLLELGLTVLDQKIEELQDRMQLLETEKDEAVNSLRKKYSVELQRKKLKKQDFEETSDLALMKKILGIKEKETNLEEHDEL